MAAIQSDVIEDLDSLNHSENHKTHPWRVSPIGKHYVRAHVIRISPSNKHPQGNVITRHAHCANNPSHKDILSFDEIQAIEKAHFPNDITEPAPKANVLRAFSRADDFDLYIQGWVQYELVQFSVENFQSGDFFHYAANPSFSV
jgi:hypothetical protein